MKRSHDVSWTSATFANCVHSSLILLLSFLTAFGTKAPVFAQTLPCCETDLKNKFIICTKQHGRWETIGNWGIFPTDVDTQTETNYNQIFTRTEELKHLEVYGNPVPYPSPPKTVIKAELDIRVDGVHPEYIEDGDLVVITATYTHMSGDSYGIFTGAVYVNGVFGYAVTRENFVQGQTVVVNHQFTLDMDGGGPGSAPQIMDNGEYREIVITMGMASDWGNDEWLYQTSTYRCRLDDSGAPDPTQTPDPEGPECIGCDPCCRVGGETEVGVLPELTSHGNHTDFFPDANPAIGCSSCGGTNNVTPERPNVLKIDRRLIPANQVTIGNLSPGVFFDELDMRLMIYDDPNDDHTALLFDTCSQKTIVFQDDGGSGTYDPDYTTYFYSIYLKNSSGNPASGPDVAATAWVISHDGWRYDFQIVPTPLATGEYGGRLTKITSPDGFEKTFAYKTFTQTEIDASPTRQFQIDSVTDPYGNVAAFTYHSTQKASRWAVSDIVINSGAVSLQYLYNTNGYLETVKRKDSPATTYETISTYTYGIDTPWSAAYIQFSQRFWENSQTNDRIFLSQDYMTWNGTMVNQFANSLVGRADGAGQKYMIVSRHSTTPGLFRIQYRGRLAEWQSGQYWRYYSTWSSSGSGFNSYTGTLEPTYDRRPSITEDEIMQATPPLIVDNTGFSQEVEYDDELNTYRKVFARDGSGNATDYEQYLYDSKNRETYRRDRAGYVTLTERDSDGHIVRIAHGFKDLDGDGTATQETGATQTIYGYYPSTHQNKGLLKWTTTNAYASGAVQEPSANTRTDFEYNTAGQLTKVTKPLPQGQSTRPAVNYVWTNFNQYSVANETGQTTTNTHDSIGRMTQADFGDSTNEQTWRDETNDIVYRKDRNGAVSRTEYDSAGRISKAITSYGHDTNILDASIATVHAAEYKSVTENFYVIGRTQPFKVTRDKVDTTIDYDYRGRTLQTVQYTAQSSDKLTSTKSYVNNMLFSETETDGSYTRRSYNGYSADRFTVRKIMTRDPTVTYADNAAVLAATRATGADPSRVIADAVRDLRGNLVQVIDGYGTITMNTFDALGRQTQTVQACRAPRNVVLLEG